MTEREWLSSIRPDSMIGQVRDRARSRQFQLLFAARFARLSWHFIGGLEPPEVTLTELADGLIGLPVAQSRLNSYLAVSRIEDIHVEQPDGLRAYRRSCEMALASSASGTAEIVLRELENLDVSLSIWDAELETDADREQTRQQVRRITSRLLRDIFGNPFRPVSFDSRWRTSDVVDVARGIYEDKAFERMPILADALMDAGCEVEQIIGHCRGNGLHVRGCWVVDLVLAKE